MIRVALVGMAHPHVQYLIDEVAARADAEIVAVCDPDPALRSRYSDLLAVPAHSEHRPMIEALEPDVVGVAGVYGDRADAIVDALALGCDVIADKPLCITLDELERITTASRIHGRAVILMLEKRAASATIATRRLVAAGELGDVIGISSTGPHKLNPGARPAWFWDRQRYGGILADLSVHDIDLMLLLTGAECGEVSAFTTASSSARPGFEDYGALLLRSGGVIASMDAHWLWPKASRHHGVYRMRVTGTEGTAELNWADGTLEVLTATSASFRSPLPAARRPAQDAFDALAGMTDAAILTHQTLIATDVALHAQLSADHGGVQLRWGNTTPKPPV